MNGLQRVVDTLARTCDRAVAIHDRQGRILAYSSHDEAVDEVRRRSILERRAPPDSLAWSRSLGVETATGPVRVPPNADFGMDARICAPIRFGDQLLGLLWLVDPHESLPESAFETIRAAADTAALAIHREQLVIELERGRERELLRDLLSDLPDVRAQAAGELIERNLVVGATHVVALAVRPVRDRTGMTASDERMRLAVEQALNASRRAAPPRQALTLMRSDHGLMLLAVQPFEADALAERVATELSHSMRAALDQHDGWRAVVGVGDVREPMTDARETYRHARQAAEVSSIVTSLPDTVRWDDLGVYQILLELPLEHLTQTSLHAGLRRLMASEGSDVWLETLERYLDLGCDARATADALNVQRGSVYYRLRRLEEIAGIDLRSGDDRLALHLGLKIARIKGLLAPGRAPATDPPQAAPSGG